MNYYLLGDRDKPYFGSKQHVIWATYASRVKKQYMQIVFEDKQNLDNCSIRSLKNFLKSY